MIAQIEALDRLIAAVEAGVIDGTDNPDYTFVALLPQHRSSARAAYNGGLDAAKALHDALLPGCFSGLSQNIHSGQWYAWAQDKSTWHYDAKNRDPARAWLLAILRAYRGALG